MPDTPTLSENSQVSDSEIASGVVTESYHQFSMAAPPSFGLPLATTTTTTVTYTYTNPITTTGFVKSIRRGINTWHRRWPSAGYPLMVLWRCSENDLRIIGKISKRLASLVESDPPNRWWGPHIHCRRHSRLAGRWTTPWIIGLVLGNHSARWAQFGPRYFGGTPIGRTDPRWGWSCRRHS